MNWAIPSAPAAERANGLKRDSCQICAASTAADTLQRCAARAIAGAKRAGTNEGIAAPIAPSACPP
jgi:hypothetical protein